MNIDLKFMSDYAIEETEYMGANKRYYYPGANLNGGNDGVVVKISKGNGNDWVGVFAFGNINNKGITGIYSTPNKDKFCVVAKGAGYIVSSDNPEIWEEVSAIPVINVYSIYPKNLLIFQDYTELVAYNANGVKWRTERLSLDGFEIVEITDKTLKGKYYSLQTEANELFEIELSTGIKL